MGQVVAIISQKGGVGKTSTAVNLGACLSAIKRRVLLIELDPQCGLAKCFGLEPEAMESGLLDLIRAEKAIEDTIICANQRLPRLFYIPSNIKTSSDEIHLYSCFEQDSSCLSRLIELLRSEYDYIFLDCPPRLDNPTISALMASDSYLVPIQCEYASMGTVGRVLRAALEVKRYHNTKLAIFGFLITMADKRAGFTVKVVQEVRQYLKDRVFRTIIPRDPRLAEVPHRREPVIAFDVDAPGARAYIQLAREIINSNDKAVQK
jgi:chromosome partitioning protein